MDLSPPQIDINTSNLKISQETQIQNYEEQYNDKFSSNNTDVSNKTNNDEKINSFSNIDQTHILTESIDPEQSLEGDRSLKPSRIPILKTKHLENTNSISSNDLSNKCINSSVEDYIERIMYTYISDNRKKISKSAFYATQSFGSIKKNNKWNFK